MDHFYLAPTPTSPEVDFQFATHTLSLRGESYPENAAAFYGDAIQALKTYLAGGRGRQIAVHIALAYFNSSSTKMLFNIIAALDDAVAAGDEVTLHWFHDAEDDVIMEFGQGLSEDFSAIRFVFHAVEGD